MSHIVTRPAAKGDLILHFNWLAERAGSEAACRFRRAVEKSFRDLAEAPRLEPPGMHDLKVGDVRVWHTIESLSAPIWTAYEGKYASVRLSPVPAFENFLIFYRALQGGVAIERVLHCKQG